MLGLFAEGKMSGDCGRGSANTRYYLTEPCLVVVPLMLWPLFVLPHTPCRYHFSAGVLIDLWKVLLKWVSH